MINANRADKNILLRVVAKLLGMVVLPLSVPIVLAEYFEPETGKDYSVGFWTKLKVAFRMARNHKKIVTGSHYLEHLLMATQILKIPRSVEGCVVECGTFKGGSATNLSLICDLCDRDLEIFDSFQGLPEPSDADRQHIIVGLKEVHTYAKGAWRGTLDEVKGNIGRFGEIDVCNFNVGYFDETLPRFNRKCVLAFLDVDLTGSLKTCIECLWPLLCDGSYLFTHEAQQREIAAVFFDQQWWRANMGCDAPGLVGAGTGIGLRPMSGGFRSDLGFAAKLSRVEDFRINPQVGVANAELP
jgi:O-methyltransferase